MTELHQTACPPRTARGFTLIEALIVMTILAILAAVGIPQYSRYVQRGNLVEATNALSEYRVRMEQFYQDNRRYGTAGACGAAVPAALQNFTVTCASANAVGGGDQTYTATATGRGGSAGFVYTVNEANVRATTGLPSNWGSLPADAGTRWVTR
jgi:type IV pilus assembly protein PilE